MIRSLPCDVIGSFPCDVIGSLPCDVIGSLPCDVIGSLPRDRKPRDMAKVLAMVDQCLSIAYVYTKEPVAL